MSASKKKLTHLDDKGNARMVDVGAKDITARSATASSTVFLSEETIQLIMDQELKKGDALSTARIAGIMAAKKTSEIIPLTHPIDITHVKVELDPQPGEGRLVITARVQCNGRTGVEMEALTAASAAALTIYDMVKAVDKGVVISDIKLLEKTGGRSGRWIRE